MLKKRGLPNLAYLKKPVGETLDDRRKSCGSFQKKLVKAIRGGRRLGACGATAISRRKIQDAREKGRTGGGSFRRDKDQVKEDKATPLRCIDAWRRTQFFWGGKPSVSKN